MQQQEELSTNNERLMKATTVLQGMLYNTSIPSNSTHIEIEGKDGESELMKAVALTTKSLHNVNNGNSLIPTSLNIQDSLLNTEQNKPILAYKNDQSLNKFLLLNSSITIPIAHIESHPIEERRVAKTSSPTIPTHIDQLSLFENE